jgi:RimJ/RimL family protein N-acetyltransferase
VALLDRKQYPVLAAALGDTPETVQSVHMLRRGLCKAWLAGEPSRFGAAILQATDWPQEPTGFGSDPALLWQLLQQIDGWTCILVESGCAPALAEILAAELGCRTRLLDDVAHVLTAPAPVIRHPEVRRLTMADLELFQSAPLELRAGLWPSPRELLAGGIVACAVLAGQIVATALTAACSDRYAEIGVYTRQAVRGRGYATAAASLVVRAAQESGRTPVWGAGAQNTASLRVAQKLGFEEVSRRTYVILA